MDRLAFKMKLLPGFANEYKKRHDELWPEIAKVLKEAGIQDYSIFLDEETHVLLATLKINNKEELKRLPELEIMKQWWRYMADIMETNPDNSPVTGSLAEMFYLR